MFKLPKNRLWVGKTNQGAPVAFTGEHIVSLEQNPYAAHIVWVRLDSGDRFIVEHVDGLRGVLQGFDIGLSEDWASKSGTLPQSANAA
jgi:hypothetical protein